MLSFLKPETRWGTAKLPMAQRGVIWDLDSSGRNNEERTPLSVRRLDNVSSVHVTAHSCLDVIAAKCAEVEWVLTQNGEVVEDHFLNEVFNRPNPFTSPYDFRYRVVHTLMSAGNSPVELTTEEFGDGEILTGLWPVMPKILKEIEPLQGGGRLYLFDTGTRQYIANDQQVHLFKTHNPDSEIWGLPPLTAAITTISTDLKQIDYNATFFDNSAIPGGLISVDQNITPKVADDIRRQWAERFKGVDKSHRVAVLGRSAEWKPAGVSHKDMQFFEGLNWGAKQVQRIFRVPNSLLGETGDGASQHQAEQGRESFYLDVVRPIISYLEWQLNMFVVQRFDPTPGLKLKFKTDLVDAMIPQKKAKAELGDMLLDNGWSLNQVLTMIHGLPRHEGEFMDEPLVKVNRIPLSLVAQNRSVLEQGGSGASGSQLPPDDGDGNDEDED